MDRFDPFAKYADVYGDIINWEKDPMNKPRNQNKYFFSDGKTYYEQICKMLRLMSVFKEAFNQIYSNEDEISEAWENFVNNLSASVVEGSEPDVTLTWTDDSVNFEFTMVPGVPGEQGVGITSISFNSDYTMTITLSDGNTYTSMSLKGETGPQGPQGETGSGLQILDVYPTLADLQSAHPTGQPGDAYQVGSAGNYALYIWSSSQSAWVEAGTLGTVSPYTSAPLMDGTASAGSQNLYARGDHVHPSDTSRASKEELDALIKTSQALIDQSFTYRESPAIQDGLARIDKIKGNTLRWNQLVQNGNFANSSLWLGQNVSISIENSVANVTLNTDQAYSALRQIVTAKPNNVYYICAELKCPKNSHIGFHLSGTQSPTVIAVNANSRTKVSVLLRTGSTTDNFGLGIYPNRERELATNDVVEFYYVNLINLTQMFGAGNEPSSAEEFASLYPLPYYEYNEGRLLSFNGTGLKTIGKNLLNNVRTVGTVYSISGVSIVLQEDGSMKLNGTCNENNVLNLVTLSAPNKGVMFEPGSYILSGSKDGTSRTNVDLQYYIPSIPYSYRSTEPIAFTLSEATEIAIRVYIVSGRTYNDVVYPMVRYAEADSAFEKYKYQEVEIPVADYFTDGMKSARNAYDELTKSKCTKRILSYDLGSLGYGKTSDGLFNTDSLRDTIKPALWSEEIVNAVCIPYTATYGTLVYQKLIEAQYCMGADGNGRLYFYDPSKASMTAEEFKNSLQGTILYIEAKNEVETAVDLDLDFNAYEDGTEQLLPVNGAVPVTSPIRADMTYLSIDDAMKYIIDKLANVPENTQQILESLEDDVADLQTDVGALQPAVSALQTSVGNINTNIGQLSSTVAGHTASISGMQSDITDLNTGLSDLEDTVTDNTSRIGTLETDLASTDNQVQSLGSSVSTLSSTVSGQGTELGEIDSIIQDISNNPVISALGSHELGFVAAYVDATLPANTGTRVTIPKPVIFPNNYTPLFIVGMSTGAYNVSICEIPHTFGNSDSVNCRVWNHGSQQTTQITVYILCMRQRQSK